MNRAYMKRITPLHCEHRKCSALAEFSVYGSHGTHFGDFCARHADEKRESLDNFYAAMRTIYATRHP